MSIGDGEKDSFCCVALEKEHLALNKSCEPPPDANTNKNQNYLIELTSDFQSSQKF